MSSSTDWATTARLLLRPWRLDEAERLLDIRRRREVAQWLGDPNPWTTIETARAKIASWSEATAEPGLKGVWAITLLDDGQSRSAPLGTVSLGQLPGSDETEIGWYLHPDSGGQGFASEAARAVLSHALRSGIEQVWAVMWPHNEPSARVALAIGMVDMGVIDDPWYGTEAEPTSRIFRADQRTAWHAPR